MKFGSFNNNRQTFGILINQIEGRYQTKLLKGFRDYSNRNNINLLVFSGRSIRSPFPSEEQFNSIYHLARSQKLEGLIIASGIIGNYLRPEEMKAVCDSFAPLPIVTIAKGIPGIPGVFTENKSVMEELVSHLIDTHGYKRIAFLKGSNDNVESEERYQGYLEAMAIRNIPILPGLIFQGDFSFKSGEAVVKEIVSRKQIHFEALVCANDDMAHAVNSGFTALDIHIPKDIALTGFDDTSDARMMSPPLTTVRQPIEEQAFQSCELLASLLKGETPPERTVIRSQFIIRESCGCYHLPFQSAKIQFQLSDPDGTGEKRQSRHEQIIRFEQNIADIRESIMMEVLQAVNPHDSEKKEIVTIAGTLIDTLLLDLKSQKTPANFLFILNELLEQPAQWSNTISTWQNILSILRKNILGLILDPRIRSFAEDIFQNAQGVAAQWSVRNVEGHLQKIIGYLIELRNTILNIHTEFDSGKWIDYLAENLFKFGLVRVFIVEYSQSFQAAEVHNLPLEGLIKLAYDENGRIQIPEGGIIFNVNEILPSAVIDPEKRYELVFMPLFSREIHFGYIAMELTGLDEILIDALREQISIALYTSKLFKERTEAENKMKAAMQALQISESRFRDMALFLPTIILETDLNNFVRFLNQSGLDTLIIQGNTGDNNALNFIHEDDRPRLTRTLEDIKQTGTDTRGEYRIISKNGSLTTMLIHIAPIRGESGLLEGFRWNAIDVKPLMISAIYPDLEFYQKFHITERAKEVMLLTLQGLKIKDIAVRLFITESTVKGHLSFVYNKLGVKNKAEMVRFLENYQLERLGYQSFVFSLLNNFTGRQD